MVGFLTPHMTIAQGDEVARMQAMSVPGIAHWAGSGPEGKTCRECTFWSCSKSYKRNEGQLEPRRCRKFPRLSGGTLGAGVPHDTAACKWFGQAASPAPIEGGKPKVDA